MAARVDFAFGAQDVLRTACEVVQRHQLAGRRIIVYCTDTEKLQRFDQLLWRFEPTAFVPHVWADDPLAAATPVLLTSAAPQAHDGSDAPAWLLNLDAACPPGAAAQFGRILEIVSLHEDDTAAARQRWRQYKAEGCELRAHDLAAQSA